MTDLKIKIKTISVGNISLGQINANPDIGRFQASSIRVKDLIGTGNDRTVAVGVKGQLTVQAIVVLMGSVGGCGTGVL
jgi:hypothetical protein